jgi:hypothetical protein
MIKKKQINLHSTKGTLFQVFHKKVDFMKIDAIWEFKTC